MSRIENPREAIKNGSTEIFCLSITCQYGLLTQKTGTPRAYKYVQDAPVNSKVIKLSNRRIRIRTYGGVRGR